MYEKTILKVPRFVDKKILLLLCFLVALAGCSNGGSGSDSGERGENTLPSVTLNDGDVLSNGNSVIRIPASDDTGIASVSARILRQGQLEECRAELDFSIVPNSLLEACLADQPTCSVDFVPSDNEVVVFPPPLYAPIGLEYELSFVDRDGSATDPTRAVFCFDVGVNAAPIPAADTYQLIFPGFVQNGGVNYNDRCEKIDGSDGVLVNDDDDEHVTNTCLTAELVELPRFASNLSTFSQSFRSNGGFRYEGLGDVPASTVDSFTYRVTDGVNEPSAPVTVQVIFSGENSAPVATNDAFNVLEDSLSQELDVLANDSDPDALPLTITSVFNGPDSGVANIRNGVVVDYTPNANFSGQDQFSYSITDSGGLQTSANVVVSVSGVNDLPVAQNDIVSTAENVALQINVLGNDTDREGDTLIVSSIATPANGTAVVGSNGQILYTPRLNFSGVDPFEYTVSDGNGGSDTATVVVTVNFVNDQPLANDDNLSVEEGSFAIIDVIANDTDPDGDSLVLLEVTAQPANGVVEIVSDSEIRYTPNTNYNGPDNFSYRIGDGATNSSSVGQVNVDVGSVNDVPVAVDDTISTTENSSVVIDVIANDTDLDEDSLTVSSISQPRNGTVTIADNERSVVYVPDAQFSGADSFTYQVVDGNGGSADATVTVQVTDTNGEPIAGDDIASTAQDNAVTISVLGNDSDPDGDALTLSIVTNATNGLAVVQGAAIVYTPEAGFDGNDALTYRVTDPGGLFATAQVSITVSAENGSPVAVDDAVSNEQDDAVTIDVLANDSDPENDSITVQSVTQPANGETTVSANALRVVYRPSAGFVGVDSFQYSISDGNQGVSTATVTVSVIGVNGPPIAESDSDTTVENVPVTIDVLANDSDPNGDAIALVGVTQPANGTATVSNGSVTYTPAEGYIGVDTFTYTIEDSNNVSTTGVVSVTVIEDTSNTVPVAVDDLAITESGAAVVINVLANDDDEDNDSLIATITGAPENGTAVVAGGAVTYTPALAFAGADSFEYTIDDGNGGLATANVSITVNAVSTPLEANDDISETDQDVTVQFDVLANDTFADLTALTLSVSAPPSNGVATVTNNVIEYTPAAGFFGEDVIGYTIVDDAGGVDSATLSITVNAVVINTLPVAVDDEAITLQETEITIDVLLNDSDPDADPLTISITAAPANGVALVVANQISYEPATGFFGTDVIEYTVDDGRGGAAVAVVTITVSQPVTVGNQLPIVADGE